MTKKKALVVFFTLCFCGFSAVFSRVLARNSSKWIVFILTFLPVFTTVFLLFALGIFLIKAHDLRKETGTEPTLGKVFLLSWKNMVSVVYCAMPVFLIYFILWMISGVFFLVRGIPKLGEFLSIILSFAPFMIILGFCLFVFVNLVLLFFIPPLLSKKKRSEKPLWRILCDRFLERPFIHVFFVTIATTPLFVALFLLIASAYLTKINYFSSTNVLFIGLQWFFLMLPFNILLTPFVIFFFHFSSETFDYITECVPESTEG